MSSGTSLCITQHTFRLSEYGLSDAIDAFPVELDIFGAFVSFSFAEVLLNPLPNKLMDGLLFNMGLSSSSLVAPRFLFVRAAVPVFDDVAGTLALFPCAGVAGTGAMMSVNVSEEAMSGVDGQMKVIRAQC